jgi:hypothetical protein
MIMEYKRREADRYARETAYFAEQHRRTMQRIEIQEDQDAAFWEEERKKREGMEAQRVRSAREFIPSALIEVRRAMGDLARLGQNINLVLNMVKDCSLPLYHEFRPLPTPPPPSSSAAGPSEPPRPILGRGAKRKSTATNSSPRTPKRARTAMTETEYDAIFSENSTLARDLKAKKGVALKLGPVSCLLLSRYSIMTFYYQGCAECAGSHPCVRWDEKSRSSACLWCAQKNLKCMQGVVPIRYHPSTGEFHFVLFTV